jgi:ferritin-like metal-binding protein YciE
MKLNSLQALYKEQLQDLYSAEQQLIKALPKMAKTASSPQLRMAFEQHLEQTKGHAGRIEQIFRDLGGSPNGKKCKGMEGLIAEGDEMIKENADADVKDAGLIAAANRVEHYEMAGYGTVRTYARLLGRNQDAMLLQQTLDEEGDADKKLTQLAESSVNLDAASGAH